MSLAVTVADLACKRQVTPTDLAAEPFRLDIATLLQRIARGDLRAFSELVDRYQRPLFAFLGRMGLEAARAEEVAQETFLRAWQHLPRYRTEQAQFSTWLFTIARRLALNELARSRNRHEVAADDDAPEPACAAARPEQALDQRRLQARIDAAFRSLGTDDRSVLALAYTHDLGMAEIAVIEGCSVDAVKTRLHRARQRLRIALDISPEHGHEI